MKKVLLFEDDYESMRDLKEHLEESFGWHVELTANARLLERLTRERFDLIVVDVMIRPTSRDARGEEVQNVIFPEVNWLGTGFEFLRRLRRGEYSKVGMGTPPDVPVIVLTAAGDRSEVEKLRKKVRLEGFVYKPFRLKELVDHMRRLLKE